MFHPMDPMGPILHYFEKRFNVIEDQLGIDNQGYKKDNDLEELNISTQEVEDLIEKHKNVKYNREWNYIIKSIKKGAIDGTSPIIVYFDSQEYRKVMMEKLNKLGFNMEQTHPETPVEDARSYNITIRKEKNNYKRNT